MIVYLLMCPIFLGCFVQARNYEEKIPNTTVHAENVNKSLEGLQVHKIGYLKAPTGIINTNSTNKLQTERQNINGSSDLPSYKRILPKYDTKKPLNEVIVNKNSVFANYTYEELIDSNFNDKDIQNILRYATENKFDHIPHICPRYENKKSGYNHFGAAIVKEN